MSSLEADYKSGKISAEKYRYFRSKYEDKLNSIDAMEATKRIRSMQGKSTPKRNKRSKNPTNVKRKQEQDLVQKYIINPKKEDARYNKKKSSSMNSGAFKLMVVLVLVIAFTAGVAYGIFNLDTETVANSDVVATVEDTAFPEIVAVVNATATNVTSNTLRIVLNQVVILQGLVIVSHLVVILQVLVIVSRLVVILQVLRGLMINFTFLVIL